MADLDDKIDFSLGRDIITINYLKLNFSAITVWGLYLLLLKSKTSHHKTAVYRSECSFISIAQLTQFKAIHQSVSHYLIEELEICQGLDFCCIKENDVTTRCFILPTLVEWMCIGVSGISAINKLTITVRWTNELCHRHGIIKRIHSFNRCIERGVQLLPLWAHN